MRRPVKISNPKTRVEPTRTQTLNHPPTFLGSPWNVSIKQPLPAKPLQSLNSRKTTNSKPKVVRFNLDSHAKSSETPIKLAQQKR